MTENTVPPTGAPPEQKESGSEILDELQSLGQQLAEAVKSLWESEESRKLRRDLEKGFTEVANQVESAVQSARESDAGRRFTEEVRETVDKARETDVAGRLERGLASGLRELNQQLTRMVDSLQQERETPPAPTPPPVPPEEPRETTEL